MAENTQKLFDWVTDYSCIKHAGLFLKAVLSKSCLGISKNWAIAMTQAFPIGLNGEHTAVYTAVRSLRYL